MKLSMALDITPQELRKLLGLPDIEKVQRAVIEKIQDKLSKAIDDATDPGQLLNRILPLSSMGIGQLEKITKTLTGFVAGSSPDSKSRNEKKARNSSQRKKKST